MTESELNDIFKYADDTTLLVLEHTDTELDVEFNHIKAWAAANCLHLNLRQKKWFSGSQGLHIFIYRPLLVT